MEQGGRPQHPQSSRHHSRIRTVAEVAWPYLKSQPRMWCGESWQRFPAKELIRGKAIPQRHEEQWRSAGLAQHLSTTCHADLLLLGRFWLRHHGNEQQQPAEPATASYPSNHQVRMTEHYVTARPCCSPACCCQTLALQSASPGP